ncbi:WCRKC thioredoxin [Trifolium repens]|nr:WCRKC thioredoxin [Trifolium repens]
MLGKSCSKALQEIIGRVKIVLGMKKSWRFGANIMNIKFLFIKVILCVTVIVVVDVTNLQCLFISSCLDEGRLQNDDHVSSLHLQPICSEDHFDRVIAEAQLRQHALLVVWIANWCRKLQFYSVDVNAVSHKLIARAGVTKMPTIQLWKDSKKQAEVIGGNKSYFVINEVQEMIENDFTI